jgi:hypothetical protein
VTRASVREYAAVQRERYLRAPRAEKHRRLNEVVAVTGRHRKAAIRLLRRPLRPPTSRPRSGRPRRYGPAVAAAAQLLSEATGDIGPHRWHKPSGARASCASAPPSTHVRQRLPMPVRGLDSDNGSEFINHDLYAWCQREGITSPAAGPTRRTTVPMSSRRTVPSPEWIRRDHASSRPRAAVVGTSVKS